MSGFCNFCQIWHSGCCCHPGRAQLILLRERVEKLELYLTAIGDMAVVDWDDAVVGLVDKAVPKPPKTYVEWMRGIVDCNNKKKKRIEELENKLQIMEEARNFWQEKHDKQVMHTAKEVMSREKRIIEFELLVRDLDKHEGAEGWSAGMRERIDNLLGGKK